jgi:hypothetical protein
MFFRPSAVMRNHSPRAITPGNKDSVETGKKINQLLKVGVRHFVDLTESRIQTHAYSFSLFLLVSIASGLRGIVACAVTAISGLMPNLPSQFF